MTESIFHTAKGPATLNIIENSALLQAVEVDGSITLAFHQPGCIELEGIGSIAVDAPCLMSCSKKGAGMQIALAEPTQTRDRIQLTVNDEIKNIELPLGPQAGSTIRMEW